MPPEASALLPLPLVDAEMQAEAEAAMEVPFLLEADEVRRLHAASGLPLEMFLASLVKPTMALARPPISDFHVGAVGLGVSGRVFRGVNLEFPGLPLNHSVHAEQCLVANAVQHGEERLRFIAVSAAPCGHCRQFLQELHGAADVQLVIVDPKVEVHSLPNLLPRRFGPQDLLAEGCPLLLEPHVNHLFLAADDTKQRRAVFPVPASNGGISLAAAATAAANGRNGFNGRASLFLHPKDAQRCLLHANGNGSASTVSLSELKTAALEAAEVAYAPYSKCPSGLSLLSSKGKVFRGSYMESAAYNPSLSPLQSALIAFVTQGGGSYEDLVQAVMVELVGAKVQHAGTIRLALEKIAPRCAFHVSLAYHGNAVPSPL